MIIFKYCGDVINIFRTFLGLNQRFNQILLDKRLHLLTDILHINIRHDYYSSDVFQQVSQQLLSINKSIDNEQLSQVLKPLISYHIQQKYIEFGDELELSRINFECLRQQLSDDDDEIVQLDEELKTKFDDLRSTSMTKECIKQIKTLVLTKGARLEFDNYELSEYNFTKAVNQRLIAYITSSNSENSEIINSFLQLFKTLIISNPSLLENKDYVGNGGRHLQYFLIHALYRLRDFFDSSISLPPVNMEYYQAIVDLYLFTIQSWKHVSDRVYYLDDNMFDVLEMISEKNSDIFLQTIQWEILKIVIDDYFMQSYGAWDDHFKTRFKQIFKQLIEKKRLDVIKYIYFYFRFEDFFNESKYLRECVNLLTRNRLERRFFDVIMNDVSLDSLFSKKHLIFVLLDKKERKLVKNLLILSPDLIHELDEDGNDPLLYICLKVFGCRHRIIEFLINIGSDLQRTNNNGQNFMDILKLQRNKKLLETLLDQEIIQIDI
ncbi:hypothetical protein I4U23_000359 [Adineta vaga]|nr:hypothetical protein I4U23_000359 [Adineta vaga]